MNQYLFELLPRKHCILHIDDDKIDLPSARCLGNLEQKKSEELFPVSVIASLKETLISFTLMEACSLGDSGHQLAEIQDTSIPFFWASDSLEKISEASGISMDISLSKSQP